MKNARVAGYEARMKKIKQKIELYHQKDDVFNAVIQRVTENAKACSHSAVIAMDYQKNLPLTIKRISKGHSPTACDYVSLF